MKLLMDIPDDLFLAIMVSAEENSRTFEEEYQAVLNSALARVRTPDDARSITDLFSHVANNIVALPADKVFTLHDVLEGIAISPNVKKLLGKILADEACVANGYIKNGKTQTSLSLYKRIH